MVPWVGLQCNTDKPVFKKLPLKKKTKTKHGFKDRLSLNAGQKYCRMLQREHSAILLAFIKLPIVIKIFVLSICEWPFYTGFTLTCAHSCIKNGMFL